MGEKHTLKSTTNNQPAYNRHMGSQPSIGEQPPIVEERDFSRLIIVIAVAGVIAVMLGLAFLLRQPPKPANTISPYAISLKFSDFKMSAAENFVGATVSYIDGSVTNSGSKTVTHIVVEVTFQDSIGQLAQREEVPLRVLKTSGPYPDAVDLSASPLAPGQTQPFRLTFDSISAQWNHQYPEIMARYVTVQ